MKAKRYTKETIRDIGLQDRKLPAFGIGDAIAVSQRIKEAGKERLQVFEGDVIAIKKNGSSSTFTVRKIGAHGVSVERILPFHSPLIKSIKVLKRGDVRRAKLYYIRERIGKSARIKEKMVSGKIEKLANLQEPVASVAQEKKPEERLKKPKSSEEE